MTLKVPSMQSLPFSLGEYLYPDKEPWKLAKTDPKAMAQVMKTVSSLQKP
jgi:hypothetical protein